MEPMERYMVKEGKLALLDELLKSRPGAIIMCKPEDMPVRFSVPDHEHGKLLATLATL